MDEASLRRDIIATALRMNELRINRGKSGNVSARIDGGFLVTPTALAYEATQPDDIVAMTLAGQSIGMRLPSSEWRFHRDRYVAPPELNSIVHAHPPFATTLACLARDIPAFHYMIAVAGGKDIRCAPYATFGTQELADHVVRGLAGRKASLLSHHGMIAAETTLAAALALAIEVETLAEM